MRARRLADTLARPAVFLAITAAAVAVLFVSAVQAYDVWWHLKAADLMLEQGWVPVRDEFSFTAAGRPWVYHSWLAGLMLHRVHEMGGVWGLVLARAGLLTVSLLLSWVAARQRNVSAGLASVLVLGAGYQLRTRALIRPHLFSFVLFVTFYLILLRALWQPGRDEKPVTDEEREPFLARGRRSRLLLLPPLTVLWANLHAGFLSGVLMIGAFGAGEVVALLGSLGWRRFPRAFLADRRGSRLRVLAVVCALCIAASMVTPYGPGVLLYPFRLLFGLERVNNIQEWQPTPVSGAFAIFWGVAVLYVLVLLRSVLFAAAAGRLRDELPELTTDLLLVAGFGLLAVRSVRHLSWFIFLVPPVLGHHLGRVAAQEQADKPAGKRLFYAAMLSLLALVLVLRHVTSRKAFRLGLRRDRFPVQACNWLEGKEAGLRPYHNYGWGGYLIWRLWPRMRVFIDGRCLVYGDDIIGEYLTVKDGGETWESVLRRREVNALILNHPGDDWSHFFQSDRWHCVYWDDTTVVALSEESLKAAGGGIEPLDLTNPEVFDRSLKAGASRQMLDELDRVLAMHPGCCTAWVFRARCLLKLADRRPERAEDLRDAAIDSARRAVRLERRSREAWEALSRSLGAAGRDVEAESARHRAESLGD